MNKLTLLLSTAFLASAFAMPGCVVHQEQPQGRGYGPPPHAPAHGYRYKYHDHDLEYDANLGVYIVLGLAGVYFLNELFYRHDHDGWKYSKKYDRDWQPYREGKLPPGLAKKYGDNDGRGRDDDRGRGNDRDDDHGHDRY